MFLSKRGAAIAVALTLSLFLSGCIQLSGGKKIDTSATDGGVFFSADKGLTWKQYVVIPTAAGIKNFASINIATMVNDPSDPQAIYYGSVGNGLLYTYDGGASWSMAGSLPKGTIRSIAVDPFDKCNIFAAIGNKVYKSDDCSRTYKQVYYDNELTVTVDSIAIDHYDSKIVYIGLSRGDLIKSLDGGESWQTIHRIADRILDIIIDPADSRIMYVITGKKGIFKTEDGGKTWSDFNAILKELKLGLDIKSLRLVKSEPDTIFIATSYGLLKSIDKGATWEQIELIPPEKSATINDLIVHPQNSSLIYYVTNTVFYKTLDGGANWTPTKLPTSRAGWKLLVLPENENIVYLGVRSLQK